MRNWRRTWLVKRLALGLAVAAVAAPAAQGARGGTDGTVAPQTDARHAALLVSKQLKHTIGGPRMVIGSGQIKHTIGGPRMVIGGGQTHSVANVGGDNATDWTAISIGAGALFGVMLLGAGGMLATRRTGREATA